MEPTPQQPGWYPDPTPGAPAGQRRYWTGRFWTVQVSHQPGAPVATPPSPSRRHRRRWPVLIGLAVVALIAVGGYFVTRSSKSYPSVWEAQVAPIAHQVEALRGLSYKHPVPVRYLTDAEFRKRVGVDSEHLSPEARQHVRDLEGTLRAFGLLDAKTDLLKSFDTVQQAGVLAFYDPDSEEIVIRGVGPLDIERKATLAHELTHVLQDQYFDLPAKQEAAEDSKVSSSGALTALVEGDAERIKFAYLKRLPEADRAAYDAAEAKTGDSVGAEVADAAEIVKIEESAPYAFGPDVLKVIETQGGNDAVNDALRRDAPTDAIYLDPTTALKDPTVESVMAPKVPAGAHSIGDSSQLGPFDLFTVLATRLDRQVALDAADVWSGDRYVTYRSGGNVCVTATIASATPAAHATMAAALGQWVGTMPGATVKADGDKRSTLTSCESGTAAAPDPAKLEGAMALLGGRNSLLAALLAQSLPPKIGECVSRGLVRTPVFVSTFEGSAELSASQQADARNETQALVRQCQSTGGTA